MQQVLRREIKYQLTTLQYYTLSHKLSKILREDANNGPDGYMIRSLYFDTLTDNDYYEKDFGVDARRKMRLRCYSAESSFALLEMKQKQGQQQRKRSQRLTRAEAECCMAGEYGVLLERDSPFTAECYGLMSRQFYRPKTVIEYMRKAYVAKENNIRITFDHNIRASQSYAQFFSAKLPLHPAIDPFTVIMEVKYDGFLLSYIKDLIEAANVSPLAAGKYSAGRFA